MANWQGLASWGKREQRAMERHRPAAGLDHQCQAKPGTGPLLLIGGAEEAFKDPAHALARNSRSLIAHTETNEAVLFRRGTWKTRRV